MDALGITRMGIGSTWNSYGERCDADYPERTYLLIRFGSRPEDAYGRHWCFKAKQREHVDAFWRAGIAAGGLGRWTTGIAPQISRRVLRGLPA